VLDESTDGVQAVCGDRPLLEQLMAPTRIYVKPLLALLRQVTVKGMAHITGGGLLENIPRVLPDGLGVRLDASSWRRPPVFDWLENAGVPLRELHRTFNCGVGMIVVVDRADADRAVLHLRQSGEQASLIGEVVADERGQVDIR
jgi:phosphoribosylformylglycinamidine cyclo-ligase